jgi:hypothetical protein
VDAVKIDRCICARRPFADLLREARANGWSLTELMDHTTAGRNCTMCAPYVRRAYRTGITVFGELLSEADEPPEPTAGGRDAIERQRGGDTV